MLRFLRRCPDGGVVGVLVADGLATARWPAAIRECSGASHVACRSRAVTSASTERGRTWNRL